MLYLVKTVQYTKESRHDPSRSCRRFCAGRALRRPGWLPHPVVFMGRCISALEKFLRARLPATPQGELLGGAVTAFCLPVGTFLLTSLVCLAAAKLSPWLGLAVQMFWCGQALAARGLRRRAPMCITSWSERPARRSQGGQPHRGPRHPEPDAGGCDQSCGGNGGRKCQRRRHCAAAVYAHRRGTAGADLQGYQYHGQHAGLQKREVPLLWPCSRQAGRLRKYIPSRLAALLWVAAAAFTAQ